MDAESPPGEMTLVLTLAAVQRLARPDAAVADARQWSTHVGVVGDDADDVASAVERAGVDPDFVSGQGGTTGALAAIRQRLRTERYVFVGESDEERRTANALGWEYLSVETAAEKADWRLADGDGPPG